jgi:hypothetical protein
MAFDKDGWANIGAAKRGNAPALYTYSTADAIADVNTAGYFNDLADSLEVNDLIFVAHSGGVALVYVASNSGGVVDVTDGLTVTATDSD